MSSVQVALMGALFTFFVGLLATLVNYYRERFERQKWQRTLELEERRVRFEEIKWALDLNSKREVALYKARLKTYPEIFTTLGLLSSHNIRKLDEKQLLELADRFNAWGYSKAGLCMLSDTRHAVFELRDELASVAHNYNDPTSLAGIISKEGKRTRLIELMRRDLNQKLSLYGDFKPLFEMDKEAVQQSLTSEDKK